ncbi:hypothetical protein HXX01_00995 [Candidatus Nomurabacteria bacterium]|nr:hypothetical protein [Candidatus Nomurabacteria bacterium]
MKQIKKETSETEDIDELTTIVDCTPPGSKEEDELRKKITQIEIKEIDDESDFDELISKYDDNSLSPKSREYLIQKILTLASTPEESFKLIDETFSNDSPEYYRAIERHREVVTLAISEMKSADDSDDIAQYLLAGTDEQLLLAKKIVEVGSNSEDIMNRKDDFDSGSEAEEILALGAIEKFSDYQTDVDELDEMIDEWSNGSRVQRIAIAKKRALLIKHLSDITDVGEMIGMSENVGQGVLENQRLEKKIILATNDLDELKGFVDGDNENLKFLAQEKLMLMITDEINTLTDSENDYNDYIEEESHERDLLDAKHVELCKDPSEVDDIADLLRSNSYALYLLAKKFGQQNSIPSIPVVETQQVDQGEEDLEQRRKSSEIKNEIMMTSNFETAIDLFNSLPQGDENKQLSYEKASELLARKIKYSKSENELLKLLNSFPERTEGWSNIIQKLAEYYPKPWWMFY